MILNVAAEVTHVINKDLGIDLYVSLREVCHTPIRNHWRQAKS